jgi:exodeoxyribonuclease V alpha subunit
MQSISGIVERVLSRKGGVFALVRYEHEPSGDLVTGKASLSAPWLAEGDWFLAQGNWDNRPGGESVFKGTAVVPALPRHLPGAVAYIRAIMTLRGLSVSERVLRDFLASNGGAPLLGSAASDPVVFKPLAAGFLKSNDVFLDEWSRRTSPLRSFAMLERAGFKPADIVRIVSLLGQGTAAMLERDPYSLALVPGIPFLDVLRFGKAMGVPDLDDRRIDAGIRQVLIDAAQQGHTHSGAADVAVRASEHLHVPRSAVAARLDAMGSVPLRRFCFHDTPTSRIVGLVHYMDAERRIAELIHRRLFAGPRRSEALVSRVMEQVFSQESRFQELDDVQRLAVRMALTEPFSIITGVAGAGKSTVMAAVDRCWTVISGGVPIHLAASTGKAAKRLSETTGREAETAHGLLKAMETEIEEFQTFGVNEAVPLPPGTGVVLDEASMLDVRIMCAVLEASPLDAPLVLVGDKNQLPSVGPGSILADLLRFRIDGNPVVPAVHLAKNYRSAASAIIVETAGGIVEGVAPLLKIGSHGGLHYYPRPPEEALQTVVDTLRRQVSQRGLKPALMATAVLCPMGPRTSGTHEINRAVSAALNPRGAVIPGTEGFHRSAKAPVPRTGDRVILTRNQQAGYVNGDLGFIVDASETSGGRGGGGSFTVQFDSGGTKAFPSFEIRNFLMAYAISVHRSQGSEWDNVILPLHPAHLDMLDRTLLYTGWTRPKRNLLLVGDGDVVRQAVLNNRALSRRTALQEYLEKEFDHAMARRRAREIVSLYGTVPVVSPKPALQPSPPVPPVAPLSEPEILPSTRPLPPRPLLAAPGTGTDRPVQVMPPRLPPVPRPLPKPPSSRPLSGGAFRDPGTSGPNP